MNPSRRSSTSSIGSEAGRLDSRSDSSLSSTTALVLIHDSEELNDSPFEFSDDDDDDFGSQSDRLASSTVPPLPPSTVFLYLLSPYLKLGALLIPNQHLPLRFGLGALFFFAVLSAFTRQIWYMLARYVRKADTEDVVLDALARGAGKERRRQIIRSIVRLTTGITRILLATVYLRGSS